MKLSVDTANILANLIKEKGINALEARFFKQMKAKGFTHLKHSSSFHNLRWAGYASLEEEFFIGIWGSYILFCDFAHANEYGKNLPLTMHNISRKGHLFYDHGICVDTDYKYKDVFLEYITKQLGINPLRISLFKGSERL